MAIIANDTQFIGIAPSIDLTGKKSALLNAQTEPVTMLDIVDTVSAGLPPSAPLLYIATLNQIGTTAPDPFVIYSDFTPTSVVRNGVGFYTFIFAPGVINEKTIASIFVNGASGSPNAAIYGITVEPTNNTVYIKTANTSGTAADGLLSGSRLQIQIYE